MKRLVLFFGVAFFLLTLVMACSKPNEPPKVVVAKRVVKFVLNKPVGTIVTMGPSGFSAPEQTTNVEGAKCTVAIADPSNPTKEIIIEGLMMKGATFITHGNERELNGDLGYKSADGKTRIIHIEKAKLSINK
jgi:hypothetical protein